MEVKIYREEENTILIMDEDALAEYNTLATELGLQAKEPEVKEQCPIVYPYLNASAMRQLRALCPTAVKAENYRQTTVPLEALRVYKFTKDNEMFEGFEIWSNNNKPDPMLLGWKYLDDSDRTKNYTFNRSFYLLARWGDCALEIPELLKAGFDAIKEEFTDRAACGLRTCKSVLDDPDLAVREFINKGVTPSTIYFG